MLFFLCAAKDCDPFWNGTLLVQVLTAAFLAIVFIQSGLDKVNDRKGNLGWMRQHFANSPLRNAVPALLSLLTVMELASGILNLAAIIAVFFRSCNYWFFWGSLLSGLTFLALFFGQRMARDYAGAQGLTGYFILSLIGIWLSC
ncbi:MAG: DoxX family protein [Bacteroidota bacterium]